MYYSKKIFTLLAIFLIMTIMTYSEQDTFIPGIEDTNITAELDEYMTALANAGRFHGSVLVARDDTILLSKGYGIADFEFSVPVETSTVFPIGSNTKQFTAAAILKLQEQGLLDISEMVTKYIPDAPRWEGIKLEHMLNHTSGIPSEGAYITTDTDIIPLSELAGKIMQLPLEFEPGKGHTYSNNGYITLSYIIEKVSGMTYDEYLRKYIFKPLEMNSTGHHNSRDVFKNCASGYTTVAGRHIHYEPQNIHNRYGAGGLHSTTEDLFKWMCALHQKRIISADLYGSMIENDYGLVKGRIKDHIIIGHGGRAVGFISYTLYFPESRTAIIFLSNHDRTPMATLAKDLSAIIFDEEYSLPEKISRKALSVPAERLEQYAGVYAMEWEKSWTYTVFTRGNRLFYTSTFPKETLELFYEDVDRFFVTPESSDTFTFIRDDSGDIEGFTMYTLEGANDKAVKIP